MFNLKLIKDVKQFPDTSPITVHLGRFGNTHLVIQQVREGEPIGIEHFCFGFDKLDAKAMEAEFKRQGFTIGDAKSNADVRYDYNWGPGTPPSFLIRDPDGLMVQMSDKDYRDTRPLDCRKWDGRRCV
jgi:hypothetical protein